MAARSAARSLVRDDSGEWRATAHPYSTCQRAEGQRSAFSRRDRARVLPELRPRNRDGAGNAGRRPRPWPACKKV